MRRNHLHRMIIILSCLFSSVVYAEIVNGFTFNDKAWEIACDNTRTCRMAGYDNDDYDQSALSILLERQAGAEQIFSGYLTLANYGNESDEPLSNLDYNPELDYAILLIDQKNYGPLHLKIEPHSNQWFWAFSQQQLNALIDALKGTSTIEFETAVQWLSLSNHGFNAVMLKMDEFQGRVDTPTAIIKTGNKPASNNYAALLPAIIYAAPVITPEQRENVDRETFSMQYPTFLDNQYASANCDIYNREGVDEYTDWNASLIHLDQQHDLLEILCWRGAYLAGCL